MKSPDWAHVVVLCDIEEGTVRKSYVTFDSCDFRNQAMENTSGLVNPSKHVFKILARINMQTGELVKLEEHEAKLLEYQASLFREEHK